MADIDVTAESETTFHVVVSEHGSSTTHTVTLTHADAERLAAGYSSEHLIAASFRFLLEREPRSSIMRQFDLPVIGRYFPSYETDIASYL